MAGKSKKKSTFPTFKHATKEGGVGVRVCCLKVQFEPLEKQKADGVDQLLGKAERTIINFKLKSKKWFAKFEKIPGMQLFAKRNMTVLDYVEKEVQSKTKSNVVLVSKKCHLLLLLLMVIPVVECSLSPRWSGIVMRVVPQPTLLLLAPQER